MRPLTRVLGLTGALALAACSNQPALEPAAQRGRQVYEAQCTACHAADPARDGAIGPAVKGSSPELLEARLLKGAYPEGYRPKRPTTVMQPMPSLAPSLSDLAAYLK
jgi:mono/diheme cytochrome c family protein